MLVPCDEYELQMNLDDLIKKLKNKRDILDVDHLIYPALNRLKDLRNRIHLQKNETPYDHDYNAFDFLVKKEMGAILYDILSSKKVSRNDTIYKFLLINKED